MNTQNFDEVTNTPAKESNVNSGNAVSWNPDAIDITANPNKGRKTTTEKADRLGRMSTTTEKHEIRIGPEPKNHHENFISVTPGIKDGVLKSDDYKKWLEKKNSFLFQPAPEITTMIPTSIAAPVSR